MLTTPRIAPSKQQSNTLKKNTYKAINITANPSVEVDELVVNSCETDA